LITKAKIPFGDGFAVSIGVSDTLNTVMTIVNPFSVAFQMTNGDFDVYKTGGDKMGTYTCTTPIVVPAKTTYTTPSQKVIVTAVSFRYLLILFYFFYFYFYFIFIYSINQ